MALIKCPDCGKEMSDTAQKCINCGKNLKEQSTIGVFIISVLVPVLGLLIYLIGKVNNNDEIAKAGIKGFIFNIIGYITIIVIGASILSFNNVKNNDLDKVRCELNSELNLYGAEYIIKHDGELPNYPVDSSDTDTLKKYMSSLSGKYSNYLGRVSVNSKFEVVIN